ncbi:MAG: phosphomannomutase/phosphoglucomutase [Nitrospinae bacterium]|nr:phosphomannomutase/phosphoglucomutase [Nitrospinota bacterium]
MMNPFIFREYDIRGRVGKDLTSDVVRKIGQGYGTYMRTLGYRTVTLGRDNRLSSREFRDIMTEGILSTGCDVIDLGMIPTPLLYFSLFYLKPDGGVMITGSHNPPDFNGFKVCIGRNTIYGEEIQQIRRIIEQRDFANGNGKSIEKDIIEVYINLLKEKIILNKGLKVVVDGGNGVSGLIAPRLLKDLGCEVYELYCEPDGNFPHHFPDPTVPAYLKDLISEVKDRNADLGIAYDGDADRIGVVDNEGNIVWGDQLMIIFSRDILKKTPGASIIFEVKCSQNLVEDIERRGGRPIMWRTGHSLIKDKMKEEKAQLGGEMSGHIFFADDYYGYDDAIYASLRLVQILSNSTQKIGDMLRDIPKTFYTPEIRIECPDEEKFNIVRELTEYFKGIYNVIDIDGVRILFKDGWGLVRASNTQPILVLRFEAKSEERLKEIKEVVFERLRRFPVII